MKQVFISAKKIERFYFKEYSQKEIDRIIVPKTGENTGKQVQINKDKTHALNLKIEDGDWFSAGSIKLTPSRPQVWRRCDDGGTWFDVNPGAIVHFQAKDKEDGFNPRINLNTFAIEKNGPEQENPYIWKAEQSDKTTDSGGKKQWGKKDFTGISIGHALNCGLWVVKHKLKDISKILELSKNLHNLTKELKAEYKIKNPEMNDYDLGAMVGNSVLNSCRIGGAESTIKKNAKIILDELVPDITAYVRGAKTEISDDGAKKVLESVPDEIIDEDDLPF